MNIIPFPKVGKFRPAGDNIDHSLMDGVLSFFSDDENSEIFRPDKIDLEVFRKYILEFPCYQSYEGLIDPSLIYQAYISNSKLNEDQEIAFLCVLELLSEFEFGFALADVFEVWGQDDRAAFLRILALHSLNH